MKIKVTTSARPRFAAAILVWLLVAATAFQPARAAEGNTAPLAVPYSFAIANAPNARIEDLMRASSQLAALMEQPPATRLGLDRRITEDLRRFRRILVSEGYYAGDAAVAVKEGDKAAVTISIAPGPIYTLKALTFTLRDASADVAELEKPLAALIGRPARAEDVLAAVDAAVAQLANTGHPFARAGERQVDIDDESRTVSVAAEIFPGPTATFGQVRFEGLEDVKADYLEDMIPWAEGAAFDKNQMEEYRRLLVESGLFTYVRTTLPDEPEAPGQPLDVIVGVSEGPQRSIGATGSYARDKGLGASVFWRHRNLLGRAEKLDLALEATELDQSASALFAKPHFTHPDRTLNLGLELRHADTDAFEEYSGTTNAGLEQKFGEHWKAGAGVLFEVSDIRESEARAAPDRTTYLFGFPITAKRSTVDDVLDPTGGLQVSTTITPFTGSVSFTKSEAESSVYYNVGSKLPLVLAARLKLGTILGENTLGVPANRRFYAGGGGSVRGYGYQLIGPLDALGDPIGGRSLAEVSLEGRVKLSGNYGLVAFLDGGTVSDSSRPGKDATVRWGAGIGGRYYTPVGPLRLDVAIPLNRRPGVDAGFQFYISFGQAF